MSAQQSAGNSENIANTGNDGINGNGGNTGNTGNDEGEQSVVASWSAGLARTGGFYRDSDWYDANIARWGQDGSCMSSGNAGDGAWC